MGRLLDVMQGMASSERKDYYECRDCGITVSPQTDECPGCESNQIAWYII